MTKRLTGINPLAYSGVEAATPPNSVQIRRPPTTQDYYGFNVGDIWINIAGYPQTLPTAEDIYYLVAKVNHVATWVALAGTNALETLSGDTGAPAVGDANDNIQIASAISTGGVFDNLNTASPGTGSQVLVALNNSIYQPNTNASGSEGMYSLGTNANIVTDRFMHNYGTGNTFLGNISGNTTLTPASAQFNTGIGFQSLLALTTGTQNTCVGPNSGVFMTSATENTCLGMSTGWVTTGINNILIGFGAGSLYTSSESNNIVIQSDTLGLVPGESDVIRIGGFTMGKVQTKCFISGIRGITTGINDAVAVLIDSGGQLGTVSSSLRFKENVKDMSDASSGIMKLRPTIFNYKADDKKHIHYGLIAEEVLEVMPDLVVHDQMGPFTVKYNDLIPMLLNEIQKLNKRIEKLEKKKV